MGTKEVVDLSGGSIFEADGLKRIPLSGSYTAFTLADTMVAEWVPYFECHKCGRFDYCKFVERLPQNPHLARDIKCGVAVAAIRTLVARSFGLLVAADTATRQHFLDGAFHFFGFVYRAELQISTFLDDDILDWWDTYAPATFGQLASLRSHLDAVAYHLGHFDVFGARDSVLLVEGWSEKAFIERLKQSRLLWFLRLDVRPYAGRGNRRLGRIELLLEQHRDKGYTVYLQGDADGKGGDPFFQLVTRRLVDRAHTFVFTHDFESAIPPGLLYDALHAIGEADTIDRQGFLAAAAAGSGSIIERLRTRLGFELEPVKMPLAEAVADLLNASIWDHRKPWWDDQSFMTTELGRFLDFLRGIK